MIKLGKRRCYYGQNTNYRIYFATENEKFIPETPDLVLSRLIGADLHFARYRHTPIPEFAALIEIDTSLPVRQKLFYFILRVLLLYFR